MSDQRASTPARETVAGGVLRALVAALLLCACGLSTRPDGGAGGGSGTGGGTANGGGATTGGGGGTATGGGSTNGGGTGGTGGGAAPQWHLDFVPGTPATPRFRAVHGLSPIDYWLLADDGTVYHSDGTGFVAIANQTSATAMAVTDLGDVFLGGPFGARACTSGCRAASAIFDSTPFDVSGTVINGVCAHPVHGVYVAGINQGSNTAMYRYAGGPWARVWFGSNVYELQGCFITDDGRAWGTGKEALIRTQHDGGWATDYVSQNFSMERWFSGTGTDAGRVIGGDGWRIATKENGASNWTKVAATPDGGVVRAVVRLGAGDDVLAGGTWENGRGLTIRRDGQWRSNPTPIDVWGAWGVNQNEFYVAGSAPDGGGGRLVHGRFY